jgi:hypothetical protein
MILGHLLKQNYKRLKELVLLVQVEVFWVVTPCSVAVGYEHF